MRRRLALIVASICCLLGVAALVRADDRFYTTAEDVRLGAEMRSVLSRIARGYHSRTGRQLYVTSGTRTPHQQADAMYDKLRLGVSLTRLYRDTAAADEIQRAYRSHRRHGRAPCVRAMARVIEAQVQRGCFISRHLHASAVDVRSRDMSRRDRSAFREVVREVGNVELLEEGSPPHFHLQM